MDFLKNSAAIASLVATLGSSPGWLCLAVLLLVSPKFMEGIA
jgi:hypothetical protein